MEQKEEEANWLAEAAENRIPLVELKPDSTVPGDVELMNETYEALNVKSFAKLRLNQLIQRLQKERELQERELQANGKKCLRFGSFIVEFIQIVWAMVFSFPPLISSTAPLLLRRQ